MRSRLNLGPRSIVHVKNVRGAKDDDAGLHHQEQTMKKLLPSKTRIPSRDELEKDTQHIAELLQEIHRERHLHLSRQQSDISGQAQRAAAQRAAMCRLRRNLGENNDLDAPWQNRLLYQSHERPQDASRKPRSNV